MKKIKNDPSSLPKDLFKAFSTIYAKSITFEELREEYVQFSKLFFEFNNALHKNINYNHKNTAEAEENDSACENDSFVENEESDTEEHNKKINLGSLLNIL